MNERGGVSAMVLWWVAGFAVFFIFMGVACSACFRDDDSSHSLGRVELINHHHDGGGHRYRHDRGRDRDGEEYGNSGSCQSGGCDNRSRRCERSSGDCRSSFSPGPFKDSPVTICLPNSCNSDGRDHGGQNPPPGEEQPR